MKRKKEAGVLDLHAPLNSGILDAVKRKSDKVKKKKGGNFPESLLQSIVPRGDRDEIENAMQSGFTLSKKRKKKKWRYTAPRNRPLTEKEARSLRRKLFQRKAFAYDDLVPLRDLWEEYAEDYLEINRNPGNSVDASAEFDTSDADSRVLLTKLSKLDLHGCEVTMQRAHCPSVVGLSGIVVQETRFTLRFVTRKNELKTVMKDGSVFDVNVGSLVFSIVGSSIMTRPADRAARKIKLLQHVFQFALKT